MELYFFIRKKEDFLRQKEGSKEQTFRLSTSSAPNRCAERDVYNETLKINKRSRATQKSDKARNERKIGERGRKDPSKQPLPCHKLCPHRAL